MRSIIFVVIFFLLQWYAFQSVRTITQQKWIYWVYWLAGVFAVAHLIYQFQTGPVDGNLNPGRSRGIGVYFSLLLPFLILSIILLGEDVARFLVGSYNKISSNSSDSFLPDRRKWLSQVGLGLVALPFAGLVYGMIKGKYNYQVLRYELFFPDLPASFDGYQITQISDIHCGSFDNPEKINYAVDLINEQQSDLLLFTGDMVNNKAEELNDWQTIFSRLHAREGKFSVLGNHDYGDYITWSSDDEKAANLADLCEREKQMGFDVLRNEHRWIQRGEEKIALIGVENWGAGGFKKAGDLRKAAAGVAASSFKILMSHDPSHWEQIVREDDHHYQLTLSGHTHGMQFGIEIPGWIKWSPVQWRYRFWAGIYRHKNRVLNVNRGFGYLAYPGRLGIWPEISVITLRKGDSEMAS